MSNRNKDIEEISIKNYLVTESINPTAIDQGRKDSDLSLLSEAEEKQNTKGNYNNGHQNPKVLKAASSLKLSNPFRGI